MPKIYTSGRVKNAHTNHMKAQIIPKIIAAALFVFILAAFAACAFIPGMAGIPDPDAPEQGGPPSPDPDHGNGTDEAGRDHNFDPPMAAVWVPTVYRLNYPSQYTKKSEILKADIDKIVQNTLALGLNTVIFQVHPASDSFYPSKIFPWSKYLTGTQGVAPDGGFDPLAYMLDACHAHSLKLHAWINPYRVTAGAADSIIPAHPAYQNEQITFSSGGKIYLDPGVPDARNLIKDCVLEIIANYDVDGIHFDDYFYPEGNIPDEDTFLSFGDGFSDIGDWRRNNNDLLIKETHELIASNRPHIQFGVSPAGVWANRSSHPLGSETLGFQSYYAIYADSRKWVEAEYIDYIAPQIYWHIGHALCDFQTIAEWWNNVRKNTKVGLVLGLAAYKEGDPDEYGAWQKGGDEIARQMHYAETYANGFALYAFDNSAYNPPVKSALLARKAAFEQKNAVMHLFD